MSKKQPRMKPYIVVESTYIEDLMNKVNAYLLSGYINVGGVSTMVLNNVGHNKNEQFTYFYQALIFVGD